MYLGGKGKSFDQFLRTILKPKKISLKICIYNNFFLLRVKSKPKKLNCKEQGNIGPLFYSESKIKPRWRAGYCEPLFCFPNKWEFIKVVGAL